MFNSHLKIELLKLSKVMANSLRRKDEISQTRPQGLRNIQNGGKRQRPRGYFFTCILFSSLLHFFQDQIWLPCVYHIWKSVVKTRIMCVTWPNTPRFLEYFAASPRIFFHVLHFKYIVKTLGMRLQISVFLVRQKKCAFVFWCFSSWVVWPRADIQLKLRLAQNL